MTIKELLRLSTDTPKGLPLKKGQLVEVDFENLKGIFRVQEDVEWNADFKCWGSVRLEGTYPPWFTHKGGIKLISTEDERKFNDNQS